MAKFVTARCVCRGGGESAASRPESEPPRPAARRGLQPSDLRLPRGLPAPHRARRSLARRPCPTGRAPVCEWVSSRARPAKGTVSPGHANGPPPPPALPVCGLNDNPVLSPAEQDGGSEAEPVKPGSGASPTPRPSCTSSAYATRKVGHRGVGDVMSRRLKMFWCWLPRTSGAGRVCSPDACPPLPMR